MKCLGVSMLLLATSGLESDRLARGLPVPIIIFLQCSLKMLMKGIELCRETAVVGVVGFRGYEPLQFLDVVERVFGCVPPDLWQLLHWS